MFGWSESAKLNLVRQYWVWFFDIIKNVQQVQQQEPSQEQTTDKDEPIPELQSQNNQPETKLVKKELTTEEKKARALENLDKI